MQRQQRQEKQQINRFTPTLERHIAEITAGFSKVYAKNLCLLSEDNIKTIVSYIIALRTETNLSPRYRRDIIEVLTKFGLFLNNTYRSTTRDNVISFLESFRKTETIDPLHKWIGTYNIYRIHLLRFFKWLYAPDIEPSKRPKPAVVDNIPELKRKEVSIYRPSDLWVPEDDLLFLKYCYSKRDRCYHVISRDLSARPHEILKLKIRDIAFKSVGTQQYVEVTVNGKTGTRPLPLINSIPYLKDYLDHEHPMPNNPNAPLICGIGKSLGKHLVPITIGRIYIKYKKEVFPKLLESPNVLPEDKLKIKELLKKAWNPYIRRHSALTEKARLLKEPILKMHAGWSQKSQTHLKYEHWFGNEANTSLLEAYGLIDHGIQLNPLKPKQCPNCSEANKPDSKFCVKCRMVLSYDSYNETIENQKEKEDDINTLKQQMQILLSTLGNMDESSKNEWAKTMVKSGVYKNQTASGK
jgi:integrase